MLWSHYRRALEIAASWIVTTATLAQGVPPIKIGMVCPFNGSSAEFGVSARNGVRLAAEEINFMGGLNGRRLVLVERDDSANPEKGKAIANELIEQERVVATIGYCNTGVAVAAIETFQQRKSVLIVPVATGSMITQRYSPSVASENYIFRVSVRDEIQAAFIVDDAVKRGWRNVAVFADSSGYGELGLRDVVRALGSHGLRPVYIARFDNGVKSLLRELQEARAAGANAIVAYTLGPENVVIAKGREALGWPVPHFGSWVLSFNNFLTGAGRAGEGALMPQTLVGDANNTRQNGFVLAYERTFGSRIQSLMSAAQAYDATYLLYYAMREAKQLDGPSIRTALETLKHRYYGVARVYKSPFRSGDHDAFSKRHVVLGQAQGGQVNYAYQSDARRALLSGGDDE